MSDVERQIGVLAAGAVAFSRRTAAERGALAERTAERWSSSTSSTSIG